MVVEVAADIVGSVVVGLECLGESGREWGNDGPRPRREALANNEITTKKNCRKSDSAVWLSDNARPAAARSARDNEAANTTSGDAVTPGGGSAGPRGGQQRPRLPAPRAAAAVRPAPPTRGGARGGVVRGGASISGA
jgi:hypothetical protein